MNEIELPRIITFSGRKESGKTELAKVCVSHGYKLMSFATPLKNLICQLHGFNSIEELNDKKNKPLGHGLDDEMYQKLSELTGIPIEYCKNNTPYLNKESTGRDWLQIIGTNLIRSYDKDWHVKHTLELLDNTTKYVFDDVRFPNELDVMRELNAVSWFVVRPKTDNISNHFSENSLTMNYFLDHIIINDKSLDFILFRMEEYLTKHSEFMEKRGIYEASNKKSHPSSQDIENMKKYFLHTYELDYEGTLVKVIPNDSKTGVFLIKEITEPLSVENYKQYIR
jgi:hypothetical protein